MESGQWEKLDKEIISEIISQKTKEESKPKKKRYKRYTGRSFTSKGMTYPMSAVPTEMLIEEINYLREKMQYSKLYKNEKRKFGYLTWVAMWRNRMPGALPKELRYDPQKWSLSEITEYNYPENIYDLSCLYALALRQGTLGKINLLHDILLQKGWIYRPGRFTDREPEAEGTYQSAFLEPARPDFSREDMKILKSRGLLKK